MGLEIIELLKKERNLTSKELSELSGVPKGTLDKILSGITKDPKLETLKSLARVLNCTLDDFDDTKETTNMKYIKETKLLNNFNKLNDLGKKKVIDYTADLSDNIKYTKNDNVTELITATKEEPKLQDMFTTIAAHDDDLTEDEKAEMDRRILEALKKREK